MQDIDLGRRILDREESERNELRQVQTEENTRFQDSGCAEDIFMGAGKYENKHGVGIMLNKRWRKRIIDTEYINERAIKTTILVNRQHIDLMSVYFPHSKYADHHIEKMYKTIEKHMTNNKKVHSYHWLETSTLSWDQEKERNEKVLANTPSTKATKEVTG